MSEPHGARDEPIVNWDGVAARRRDAGHIRGAWRDLGRAAGSRQLGLRRIDVDPGGWTTPAHTHAAEEEIFHVLAGDGVVWHGGATYAVAAGDTLAHRPGGPPHSMRAGEAGLAVLAFGERRRAEATYLPRAGVAFMGTTWTAVGGEHPDAREAAAGPPDAGEPEPRPEWIVALQDVAAVQRRRGEIDAARRGLGTAAGARSSALKQLAIAPGALAAPPHAHSAEEELFVVLEGSGALELSGGGGNLADDPRAAVDESLPVRAGDVVVRRAGTGTAHTFRAAAEPLTLLAYSRRDPTDVCFYPRSGKIALRGLGVIFNIERAGYWDGED